jgi:hypothetical protein
MSDFEDDLSESEVSQTAPPKKQGMNLPKVSTPVALGVGLLALVGSVGVWFALNSAPAPVPDPVVQTQPITAPSTTTTTPPSTTTTTTTVPTTAAGTGVEAGNIPLIANKPTPTTSTTAVTTKPTAKPAIKPAPKPAAPRVVNPFAPLPQSGSTSVAVVNSGNQGGPVVAVFNPQPSPSTVAIVRPTATPQVIRTPIVSSPFAPRPTTSTGVATSTSGTSTPIKPVPVVVAQQRPVIPKVLITKTPQAAPTTITAAARPPITGLVARPAFSVTPQILAASPRTQAPIQATTPSNTTNSTTPSVTPTTTAATQTPSTPIRPVVSDPPVFKIEPAPVSRPTSTPPVTTTPTQSTAPTTPVTPPSTTTPTTTPATQPSTNTTPTTTTPVTQPSTNTIPTTTTPVTQPTTNTTPTTPVTQPSTTTPVTQPSTTTPVTQPSTTTPVTQPSTNTTPTTPATPSTTAPATPTAQPTPTVTVPTIPAAPTTDLIELRRVVQEDLRLEYAGFSIGTVKKAFFQSSRGLLSIAEGDPLIRDSSVILKSVSPTEVVLALGNELLTLPLVKR